MKKLYSIFLFIILFATYSQAQIMINEIMYNPPESGTDSLEYIELHNASATAVDISGWQFTRGISYTFPAGTTIPANGFVVATAKINALTLGFGYTTTHEWPALVGGASNGLSNSGEGIELRDGGGVFIDSVRYGSSAPWPTLANGSGPSIELISSTLDNTLVSSWGVAVDSTNTIVVNNKRLKGTPGRANTATPSYTDVVVADFSFTPKDITIFEGQTVRWTNTSGTHNVNGSQSVFPTNPVGFTNGAAAGGNWVYTYTFNTAGLYKYQCDPHAPDMAGTVFVRSTSTPVNPITYQIVTLDKLQSENASGVADSLNKYFEVSAIVYGINIRGNGVSFTIIDNSNNGLGVFNSTKNFGYTVTQGDEVKVRGRLSQFSGLSQITADTIWKVSGGNALITPFQVTRVSEVTESKLVRANSYKITNPTFWTNTGSNFTCRIDNGTDTIMLIIDSLSSLYGTPAPMGTFDVIGIGSQFDSSSPYTSGYQLRPRFLSDLIITSTNDLLDKAKLKLYPNPVSNRLQVETAIEFKGARITNQLGQVMETFNLNQGSNEVNMSKYPSGQYFLNLQQGKSNAAISILKL